MKQMIRITEGQLHRIIDESVRKVINEIGDTKRGSYMLGRLANRSVGNYSDLGDKTSDYDAFDTGYSDEGWNTFSSGDEPNRGRIPTNYYKYNIDDLTNKRK